MSLRSVDTGIPIVTKLGSLLCLFHYVTFRYGSPGPYISVTCTQDWFKYCFSM